MAVLVGANEENKKALEQAQQKNEELNAYMAGVRNFETGVPLLMKFLAQ